MLKIYNTLARDKQEFVPIEPGKVRMYVCGMTVYDYCHLGHARVLVVFDMVYRWLKASGYDVTYVRNITDIDDKIIKRAAENGESIHALTARFIAAMHEDAAALGVLQPDHEPRATQYVPQMLEMIGRLEQNGLAYRAADGDVYYAVRKFPGYGKLSGKSLEDLRAGERVDVTDRQERSARLRAVETRQGAGSRRSEVGLAVGQGPARLAYRMLGDGLRNCSASISTSTAAARTCSFRITRTRSPRARARTGAQFVNYWMHNGFVRVDEEKMSKSLGNFFTIREVLKKYDAEVVRFFILRAHYRSPLNYSDVHLDDAKGALTRLYTALKSTPPALPCQGGSQSPPLTRGGREGIAVDWNEPHAQRFKVAMDDDFNTPEAMAVLFDLANEANRNEAGAQHAVPNSRHWEVCSVCCNAIPAGIPARRRERRRSGRCRNRRADRSPHRRQAGQKLRRSRPHPQGIAGGGYRAGRQCAGTTWRRA